MMLPDIFERKQAPQAAAAPSRRHHVARCSSRHTADSAASAQAVNARSEVMSPPCASRAGQNTASTRASPPAARPNSPRAQRQVMAEREVERRSYDTIGSLDPFDGLFD